MFPSRGSAGNQKGNLSISLFGNRIYSDQSLEEYLIEFLLVFASAKERDGSGKMAFHSPGQIEKGALPYYVNPRVALRRFVFYDRSKQDSRSPIDTAANNCLKEILLKDASGNAENVELIHDLLLSYASITRNRGWYAQALLPVAPELLMTDLQGIRARQRIKNPNGKPEDMDRAFEFDKHNFLARGGQVLYLHLLQGLANEPFLDGKYRQKLQRLLQHMLISDNRGISLLADFVQTKWENAQDYDPDHAHPFTMGTIPEGYAIRAERFLSEITTFLENDIHPISRIELLSQGIVLSLLRIMHIVAHHKVDPKAAEPLWIMDMSGLGGASNIARLSADSYRQAYDDFQTALIKICEEEGIPAEDWFTQINKVKKDTADVFKRLAKQMQLVIPPRGDRERFSLSESLVRYLVLSLVAPGRKMTLDSFLEELYVHFRMVIGPSQYRIAVAGNLWNGDINMTNYFEANVRVFQEFLKQCGFLRALSDATAIIENPYREVHLD